MMNRLLAVLLLLGSLVFSRAARAEDQDLVLTARELARQGFRAYHDGRYEEAAEKSLQAYRLVRMPTLAVNSARSLEKLGKLVQAAELYSEASRLNPTEESWQEVQYEAQRNAERELSELLPRIPRLKILIEGAEPAQVAITIGETPVSSALLAAEQRIDPGEYRVIGRRGDQEVRASVSAKEAAQLQVTLRFSTVAPRENKGAKGMVLPTLPPISSPSNLTSIQSLAGWCALGLGGVGIVFGTIEGLSAQSKRTALLNSGKCPDQQHCDVSLAPEVDSLMARRRISTVGFVAGGILSAAGVTLLLWPSKRESSEPVALAIGPGFLSIRGELQ